MKITDEAGKEIDSPLAIDIERVIQELDPNDNTYAILERESGSYMQTMALHDGVFELEYQEGGVENHFRSKEQPDESQVIRAMSLYASGDEGWKEQIEWEPLDLNSSGGGCFGVVLLFAIGATAVASAW